MILGTIPEPMPTCDHKWQMVTPKHLIWDHQTAPNPQMHWWVEMKVLLCQSFNLPGVEHSYKLSISFNFDLVSKVIDYVLRFESNYCRTQRIPWYAFARSKHQFCERHEMPFSKHFFASIADFISVLRVTCQFLVKCRVGSWATAIGSQFSQVYHEGMSSVPNKLSIHSSIFSNISQADYDLAWLSW